MFLSLTRGFSIVFCAVNLYKRLMNLSGRQKSAAHFDLGLSALAALCCFWLERYIPLCRIAGLTVIVLCYMALVYKQSVYTSVTVTVIAVGLSLLCYVLAGIVASLIVTVLFLISNAAEILVTGPILRIAVGVLQILIAWLPFRFERLRAGMPFLQRARFDEPCLFVGIFLIAATMLIRTEGDVVYQVGAILAFGMLLFVIWHNRLIQTYLLEKAWHHAKAMEAEANEAGDELLRQYHSQKRMTSAIRTMIRNNDAADAGVDSVAVTLRYMAQLAENQHVSFEAPTIGDVRQLVDGRYITEIRLATLLGDLIENALVAVRPVGEKHILLAVEDKQPPAVCVYDSGVPFEPETIRKLGIERASTHRGEGGSGLGMMVVFDILRFCKASLIIDELPDRPGYTKAVSVRFDELGQIRIKTERPEILEIERDGMIIEKCAMEGTVR